MLSYIAAIVAAVSLAALWGCGTANDTAPAVDSTGKHPTNWVVGHRSAFHRTPEQCRECHGPDLAVRGSTGGITRIGCFAATWNGMSCHALVNGQPHGPRNLPHAIPFTSPGTHGPEAKRDLVGCQECHGEPGISGSNPRFNATIGSLSAGCEASGCHITNAAHPVPWLTHGSAGNLMRACSLCHGTTLRGGVARSCFSATCHPNSAPGTVPVAGQCTSCHGKPPNGLPGASSPNIAGAHAKHGNVPGIGSICETCHTGAGTGTANHANGRADVAFTSTYNAKSGPSAFDGGTQTCTNVSCHGGEAISWTQAFESEVHDGCIRCHAFGTNQYNSYHSGKHPEHERSGPNGLLCTDCHDIEKLRQKHFSGLSTPQFEGTPRDTLRDEVRYNGTTCSPPGLSPLGACHFDPVERAW
ncbi:hypothetical protein [Geobacter sp. DSM 9736]|uniref:c-type cytochrome n=1 Tax=Geobacter sp. DSM 9736 TaxID=1277350 RepID=UPI000B62100C|nr:hypothetical protein [Geobacter sp. DSM 9736]SNB46171.1 Geobacter sulfurreducens CxxxxCH...CXXCH domain-containing protein [Geobacter sp. DSM 9736]